MRPKGKPTDDDEGPTIVDEENNSVSKEEYEALLQEQEVDARPEDAVAKVPEDKASEANKTSNKNDAPKQELLEVGMAQKKRKAAKIVGADEADADGKSDATQNVKKPKKKTKALALSFEDNEP